ncbi:zinc transporter 1-like [Haliotis rufescens]|uniref:zinc transporter 1-like n=1 Tax=Haliotis rufescens TaxID=6454 RepID=UPI001EB0844B|nr:zinc transporter 1-like [Haliotis rufescens]
MGRYSGKTCRLLTMLGLTGAFFLVEIIVGYITNSVALVADSFHMLSDVVALIVGFSCVRIARWPSEKNTFGWIRAEVLGALVNSVFLLALCFSILVESLKRLVQVEEIDDPKLMLIVGVCGLVVNLIGLALFHQHGHSHGGVSHSHGGGSHSHNSDEEPSTEKEKLVAKQNIINGLSTQDGEGDMDVQIEIESSKPKVVSQSQLNMRGVFLHVLGDALGSVIVIISALVIWFVEGEWKYYVDPVMSILLVIIIISTTIPLLKDSSYILLQAVPKHIRTKAILRKIEKLPGIVAIHEFHIWQLAGNRIVATAHLSCHNVEGYMLLATQVKEIFHDEGIHSTTIQPEFIEAGQGMNKRSCVIECRPDKNCIGDTCCGKTGKTCGKSFSPNDKDRHTPTQSQSEPIQSESEPIEDQSEPIQSLSEPIRSQNQEDKDLAL